MRPAENDGKPQASQDRSQWENPPAGSKDAPRQGAPQSAVKLPGQVIAMVGIISAHELRSQ
ncbi:hypothetical protein [Bacteroides caccae]|uniref:hypothetical protein n=1 Tax=Bacteroides caccae TaxID=47678 RepID=UPI001230F7E4|nr:hypothetical protein F2Y49_24740 [Bacteroides caccae]